MKMAMGMRVGAGGVPMLPFAGDPNGVGGPTPVVGQILVDTVSGALYQGVRGGLFSGNDSVFTSAFDYRDPVTMSSCWAMESDLLQNPTGPYALLSERNGGIGPTFVISSTSTIEIALRISTTQAYIVTFDPKIGLGQQRIAARWDHATTTLTAWCGVDKLETAAPVSFGGTVTSRSINSANGGIHRTPFYGRIAALCDADRLESWAKYQASFDVSQADVLYDMSRAVLTGSTIPNVGSLSGNFTRTDGSPGTWNSEYWRRIA